LVGNDQQVGRVGPVIAQNVVRALSVALLAKMLGEGTISNIEDVLEKLRRVDHQGDRRKE
jgi:hypothetical protein